MTFFKISFINFKDILNRKLVNENEENTPVSYYESKYSFLFFKPKGCIIFWAEMPKEELESIDAFKTEFIKDTQAVALIELPFPKVKAKSS